MIRVVVVGRSHTSYGSFSSSSLDPPNLARSSPRLHARHRAPGETGGVPWEILDGIVGWRFIFIFSRTGPGGREWGGVRLAFDLRGYSIAFSEAFAIGDREGSSKGGEY